jgi:NADH-quinone oxidoreductase subunit L
MLTLIPLIPLLPLVGFTINILVGKRLRGTSAILAIAALGMSFVISVLLFVRVLSDPTPMTVSLYSWIPTGSFDISMGFLVDRLTAVYLLVVTGVGTLIHIYSIGYMHGDSRYSRFFAYLNLFAAMMLILVLADNYIVMFLGWEGVGLCSYLLIGFWFERPFDKGTTNDAARKAFVVNRIGDFGFLIGVFLIWTTVGSVHFATIEAATSNGAFVAGGVLITMITLLLFVGATGKSAQIPLYVWLPDAMAGPTPVSALIHAATMVTAGVYMVARSNFLFNLAPTSQTVVLWVGALTALFAGTMGVAQNDIKKILAYSTISQLGYMFMGVGVGAYAAGVFHVMTHAFFKALLFLGAGAVIHALHEEQDITKMGGLKNRLPGVYWPFLIASLALAGFPLTSGFFSKDAILAHLFDHGHFAAWAVGVFTAGLTAFYTFRLFFLTFHGPERNEAQPHAPGPSIGIPLAILGVLSLIGGYFEIPMHIYSGFSHFLSPVVGEIPIHLSVGTEIALMAVTFALVAAGIYGAWLLYVKRPVDVLRAAAIEAEPSGFLKVLRNKWYVDELYALIIVKPLYSGSRTVLWRAVDDWIIQGFLVQVVGGLLWKAIGFVISFWHTGRVGSYAFGIVLGALALFWMFI